MKECKSSSCLNSFSSLTQFLPPLPLASILEIVFFLLITFSLLLSSLACILLLASPFKMVATGGGVHPTGLEEHSLSVVALRSPALPPPLLLLLPFPFGFAAPRDAAWAFVLWRLKIPPVFP